MRDFKFFVFPLFEAHDGGDVYAGNTFYTVLKEDYTDPRGKVFPKYTIIKRNISIEKRFKFKVNNDMVWYFRSKNNAQYLIREWKRQDIGYGSMINLYYNNDKTIQISNR